MPITALQTRLPELELTQPLRPSCRTVLTPDALDFVAALVAEFTPDLRDLLDARDVRQARFDAGPQHGQEMATECRFEPARQDQPANALGRAVANEPDHGRGIQLPPVLLVIGGKVPDLRQPGLHRLSGSGLGDFS